MLFQVNRTKLPPMLDYDVQESVYRDKDGCVCVHAFPSLALLLQAHPAPTSNPYRKPILHRNCNVRFEVAQAHV